MNPASLIHVSGVVQGVGFRPFVYRVAHEQGVCGWVRNTVEGVLVHAEGTDEAVDALILEIAEHAPAAAQVKEISIDEVPAEGADSFEILFSDGDDALEATLVSPDLATCDECVAELFDPENRRYHYPFINCTNCGPRFTIIDRLPYDRPATTMAPFEMCESCAAEYADPANRRFHAQPDACFECGPHIGWRLSGATETEWGATREASDAIIARAVSLIEDGGIVAVKGLGGYHLVCDASNEAALAKLRERKHRDGKGFAVMVATADDAETMCRVQPLERQLLESPARPIVLLRKRPGASFAPGLADRLPELGVMLPATPVQHLLIAAFGGMLVMTSGNLHDEPIVTNDDEAFEKLKDVADAFICNNRAIRSRYDDSVVRVIDAGQAGPTQQMIRRARGYAPLPLRLAAAESCVFATGPEQKNTFTLTRTGEAFVSQHIGDMESPVVYDAWLEAAATYRTLFGLDPQRVATDMHPEYLTSKWAHAQELPVQAVQHHHAHVAAVLAENELTDAACGIAFDGTGYGADGCIWGGEVLLANTQAYERFANFAYFPLPGGTAAIKHPLRAAYGALWACDLLEHPAAASVIERLGDTADFCSAMIDQGLNTPMTSSVGRLFDAVSALCGVCEEPSYEGQAAIEFEAAIDSELADLTCAARAAEDAKAAGYTVDVLKNTALETSTAQDTSVVLLDPAALLRAVLDDIAAGTPVGTIARRFHDAIVGAVVLSAQLVQAAYGVSLVALSGGVFMNRYLIEHSVAALIEAGFSVALNRELPPNDASVSYGQAVVACGQEEQE